MSYSMKIKINLTFVHILLISLSLRPVINLHKHKEQPLANIFLTKTILCHTLSHAPFYCILAASPSKQKPDNSCDIDPSQIMPPPHVNITGAPYDFPLMSATMGTPSDHTATLPRSARTRHTTGHSATQPQMVPLATIARASTTPKTTSYQAQRFASTHNIPNSGPSSMPEQNITRQQRSYQPSSLQIPQTRNITAEQCNTPPPTYAEAVGAQRQTVFTTQRPTTYPIVEQVLYIDNTPAHADAASTSQAAQASDLQTGPPSAQGRAHSASNDNVPTYQQPTANRENAEIQFVPLPLQRPRVNIQQPQAARAQYEPPQQVPVAPIPRPSDTTCSIAEILQITGELFIPKLLVCKVMELQQEQPVHPLVSRPRRKLCIADSTGVIVGYIKRIQPIHFEKGDTIRMRGFTMKDGTFLIHSNTITSR